MSPIPDEYRWHIAMWARAGTVPDDLDSRQAAAWMLNHLVDKLDEADSIIFALKVEAGGWDDDEATE